LIWSFVLTAPHRHTALISLLTGDSPSPNAFDLPLAASEVLSIAGGFFSGCTAEDLGLTANKPLVCSNKNGSGGEFKIGSQLAFTSNVELPDTTFCQIIIPGQSAPIIMPISQWVYLSPSFAPAQPRQMHRPRAGRRQRLGALPFALSPPHRSVCTQIFVTTDETPLSVGDSQARATAGNLCAGPAQVLVQPEHVRPPTLCPTTLLLTSRRQNGFADFFSSALEVGHINGAQCGINQVRTPPSSADLLADLSISSRATVTATSTCTASTSSTSSSRRCAPFTSSLHICLCPLAQEVVVIINNDNDDDKDRKDRGKKRQRKYQLGGRRSEH
jgi:hypothetical protein